MGPPNGILDEPLELFNDDGSQPATQPLNDSQQSETDEQNSMSEDDQVRWHRYITIYIN